MKFCQVDLPPGVIPDDPALLDRTEEDKKSILKNIKNGVRNQDAKLLKSLISRTKSLGKMNESH